MEREVIVVGAGPAGSTVAMALAQKGRDVLLLDRQEFPRDKACGDAVPAGAIHILQKLGMSQIIKDAEDEKFFYRIDSLRLVSPGGHIFEAGFRPSKVGASSYIVPRIHFDALLQKHAVSSGVEFLLGQAKLPLIENNHVIGVRARFNGTTKDIRAKFVIAADGATSPIARALRHTHHTAMHRAVALRAYIEDIEELPHRIEFYLLNLNFAH